MNPEKMRTTYGKLMFLLQDANSREVRFAVAAHAIYSTEAGEYVSASSFPDPCLAYLLFSLAAGQPFRFSYCQAG